MSLFGKAIPVTVLTGFLGSGKTTLLANLLSRPDFQNTAVIINEFGDVGLDHGLIDQSDETVLELQNGCICCTIREDLQQSMGKLITDMQSGRINPIERVVIETTGLADPIPILQTIILDPELYRVFELGGIITVVDGVNAGDTLARYEEARRQVMVADSLAISKSDLINPEQLTKLTEILTNQNPLADIWHVDQGRLQPGWSSGSSPAPVAMISSPVQNWMNADTEAHIHTQGHHLHQHSHADHSVNRHGADIEAFSLVVEHPISSIAFSFFIDMVSAEMGPDLLRVKGLVNLAGEIRPALIQGAQQVFHPVRWLDIWPDNDTRTRIVFITRLDVKDRIRTLFNALTSATSLTTESQL